MLLEKEREEDKGSEEAYQWLFDAVSGKQGGQGLKKKDDNEKENLNSNEKLWNSNKGTNTSKNNSHYFFSRQSNPFHDFIDLQTKVLFPFARLDILVSFFQEIFRISVKIFFWFFLNLLIVLHVVKIFLSGKIRLLIKTSHHEFLFKLHPIGRQTCDRLEKNEIKSNPIQ